MSWMMWEPDQLRALADAADKLAEAERAVGMGAPTTESPYLGKVPVYYPGEDEPIAHLIGSEVDESMWIVDFGPQP